MYRWCWLNGYARQSTAESVDSLGRQGRCVTASAELGYTRTVGSQSALSPFVGNGVPVQYQKDGETRGDFVRLIDFADGAANEWLAVNQFSIKGAKYTRRPTSSYF